MENASNVSSEEELLQLRNEGKISEAEYNDLLHLMKTRPAEPEEAPSYADKSTSKRKIGKIAFALMLAGVVIPLAGYVLLTPGFGRKVKGVSQTVVMVRDSNMAANSVELRGKTAQTEALEETRKIRGQIFGVFYIGPLFEIAAFVMGVISWPDVFGKATVITISVFFAIALLLNS